MNPTDLQRRLDAVALPSETASPQDWERNRALVARRRRRRRIGTGALAGLAAAAGIAAVLTWNPSADHLELAPAQSPALDARAHLVDPRTLVGTVTQCTENAEHENRLETPTPIFGARSDLAIGVLYEYPDGSMRFCSTFGDDGGIRADGAVSPAGADANDPDAPEGEPRRTTWSAGSTDVGGEGSRIASFFGFVPATVDSVVVTAPDGQEYDAALSDGRWWTSVWLAPEADVHAGNWTAYDADGQVVEEGIPAQ